MPSPGTPSTFNRPDLGLHFEEYNVNAASQGFVGPKIMPFLPVALQTASFSKITVASLLEDIKTERAPGAGYERGSYQFEQDSYACIEHGTEEPVDDAERAIYAYSFDVEMQAANRCVARLMRGAEKRIVAPILASANTTATAGIWSTSASGKPFTDVMLAAIQVRNRTGIRANAVVMDWAAFEAARACDEVLNRVKFWGGDDPAFVTAEVMARAMNVKYCFISGGMKNTGGHGLPAVLSPIWDKTKCAVLVVPESSDLREPCYGRTFQFTGDGGANGEGGTVEQYREEIRRSEIIRARHWAHEKVLYSGAVHVVTGVVTA